MLERLRFRIDHGLYSTFARQNRWKLWTTLITCFVAVLVFLLVKSITH